MTEVPFTAELSEMRRLADLLPGAKPLAINGVRVAASIRPRRFVIEGGDDTPVTMPRTAFQLVYPDGTLMLDSGLDAETHASFGEGRTEPYFPEAFKKLRRALERARLIVLTHFHADHVAGVLRAPDVSTLMKKTMITATTADFLVNRPHREHLRVAPEVIGNFIIVEYRRYLLIAPGLVLIPAPGHSPDSQMVFIKLQSGREILHSVDSAWIMDSIREVKGKAAPWVVEDVPAVVGQLRWLNNLAATERDLTILVTHDNDLFASVTRSGIVGAELSV